MGTNNRIYAGIVVALIILLLSVQYFRFSAWNTETAVPGETYIHREHVSGQYGAEAARDLLAEVTRRSGLLLEHLETKYGRHVRPYDPAKRNAIDVTNSELYTEAVEHYSAGREFVQERINQLVSNYTQAKIYEISPLNREKVTSYTENKQTFIFCLRSREPDANGEYPLADINTMMFVVVHEMTHMMNNTWGHDARFWQLCKFMLQNAVECGIYRAVDYSSAPQRYCGINLSYNPLYDTRITL